MIQCPVIQQGKRVNQGQCGMRNAECGIRETRPTRKRVSSLPTSGLRPPIRQIPHSALRIPHFQTSASAFASSPVSEPTWLKPS